MNLFNIGDLVVYNHDPDVRTRMEIHPGRYCTLVSGSIIANTRSNRNEKLNLQSVYGIVTDITTEDYIVVKWWGVVGKVKVSSRVVHDLSRDRISKADTIYLKKLFGDDAFYKTVFNYGEVSDLVKNN